MQHTAPHCESPSLHSIPSFQLDLVQAAWDIQMVHQQAGMLYKHHHMSSKVLSNRQSEPCSRCLNIMFSGSATLERLVAAQSLCSGDLGTTTADTVQAVTARSLGRCASSNKNYNKALQMLTQCAHCTQLRAPSQGLLHKAR